MGLAEVNITDGGLGNRPSSCRMREVWGKAINYWGLGCGPEKMKVFGVF